MRVPLTSTLSPSGGEGVLVRSRAPPFGGAVRLVFEDDPLGREFGANAVGIGKPPLLSGEQSVSDTFRDMVLIRAAVKPIGGVMLQQPKQPSGQAQHFLFRCHVIAHCSSISVQRPKVRLQPSQDQWNVKIIS